MAEGADYQAAWPHCFTNALGITRSPYHGEIVSWNVSESALVLASGENPEKHEMQ